MASSSSSSNNAAAAAVTAVKEKEAVENMTTTLTNGTPSKNSSSNNLSDLRASDIDIDIIPGTPFRHGQIVMDYEDGDRSLLYGKNSSSSSNSNSNSKNNNSSISNTIIADKGGESNGSSNSYIDSISNINNNSNSNSNNNIKKMNSSNALNILTSSSIITSTGMPPSIDHQMDNKNKVTYVDIYSWKIKKDGDRNVFVAYLVHVSMQSGMKWIVERRYQQFRSLRRDLRDKYENHDDVPFPSKKWFFNLSESTIKSRLKKLQEYINAVLSLQPYPQELNSFLQVEENIASLIESSSRVSARMRSSSSSSVSSSQSMMTQGVSVYNFTLVRVLGKGSFGKVFLVKPNSSLAYIGPDKVYAMKVLKKADIVKKHQVDHTKAERYILETINHNFVLKLKYAFQTKQKLFMITDYCPGGELFFHLKKMKKFTENMTVFYAGQVSLALKHLHDHNIIYRDLKPENILLDSNGNCKITDFGLSKVLTPDSAGKKLTFCGTPEYLAPELIIMRRLGTTSYGFEVDWWGLGIVCYELMTGWPPFNDRDFTKLCQKILSDPIKFSSKFRISLDGQNFINNLLHRDPSKRLGCSRNKDRVATSSSNNSNNSSKNNNNNSSRSSSSSSSSSSSPNNRLDNNSDSLFDHPFFSNINWADLRACRVVPPFVPNLGRNEEDTRNFDKEFTRMTLRESPNDPSHVDEGVFEGFSFDDNMGRGIDGRYSIMSNSNHISAPIVVERDARPYMSTDRDSITRLSETIIDQMSSPTVSVDRSRLTA